MLSRCNYSAQRRPARISPGASHIGRAETGPHSPTVDGHRAGRDTTCSTWSSRSRATDTRNARAPCLSAAQPCYTCDVVGAAHNSMPAPSLHWEVVLVVTHRSHPTHLERLCARSGGGRRGIAFSRYPLGEGVLAGQGRAVKAPRRPNPDEVFTSKRQLDPGCVRSDCHTRWVTEARPPRSAGADVIRVSWLWSCVLVWGDIPGPRAARRQSARCCPRSHPASAGFDDSARVSFCRLRPAPCAGPA